MNEKIYGKDFAAVYNEKWSFWAVKMWPFLRDTVKKRAPHAKSWLDLCCGTGTLLQRITRRRFEGTGVDVSKHQLRHARRNAPGARFVASDIRTLALDETFDVMTCMFDSLNYLTRSSDLLKAFRVARRHLAEDGVFVFDMNTYEGLEDSWCQTRAMEEPGRTIIVETSFQPRRALGRCLITGFTKRGAFYTKFQEEHVQRAYRAREIEDLLARAGFSFRKYDGYSLGRPRKRSGRLLYVCERAQPQARRRRKRTKK